MISVVVPAFNAERTLEACLRAVLGQRMPAGEELELLVVDNGSHDGTAAIGRRLATRLLFEETPGPAAARNRGLAEARGEWIAFVDADCELPAAWLETARQLLVDHPEVVAVGGPGRVPNAGWPARCLNGLHYGLAPDTPQRTVRSLATMDVLFRGDVLRKYRFDERYIMGEDPELNLRLIRDGWSLLFDPGLAVAHHHPMTVRGIARKWFEYGVRYPEPYLGHRLWFFEAGLLPRLLYLPLLLAAAGGAAFAPPLAWAAAALLLAWPAAYLVVGWRTVRGWDRLRFPWVHTVKQWGQMMGIWVGLLRPRRRMRTATTGREDRG